MADTITQVPPVDPTAQSPGIDSGLLSNPTMLYGSLALFVVLALLTYGREFE